MGSNPVNKTQRALTLFFYQGRLRRRHGGMVLDARTLAYFGAMLVLIGLAGWLYLHQASEVAAYAREIRGLEERKEELHRELVALRGQVAVLGSLERIRAIGEQSGYDLPPATAQDRQLHLAVQEPAASPTGLTPAVTNATDKQLGFLEGLVDGLLTWLEVPENDPDSE